MCHYAALYRGQGQHPPALPHPRTPTYRAWSGAWLSPMSTSFSTLSASSARSVPLLLPLPPPSPAFFLEGCAWACPPMPWRLTTTRAMSSTTPCAFSPLWAAEYLTGINGTEQHQRYEAT